VFLWAPRSLTDPKPAATKQISSTKPKEQRYNSDPQAQTLVAAPEILMGAPSHEKNQPDR